MTLTSLWKRRRFGEAIGAPIIVLPDKFLIDMEAMKEMISAFTFGRGVTKFWRDIPKLPKLPILASEGDT